MSLKTIVINDGASTPAAQTFVQRVANPGVLSYRTLAGSMVEEQTLSLLHKEAKVRKIVRIVMGRPVVQTETVNGISSPKLIRSAYGSVDLTYDRNASVEERDDMIAMLGNLFLSSDADVRNVLRGVSLVEL
jgi:hypothetical protein